MMLPLLEQRARDLDRFVHDRTQVDLALFSNSYGLLGKTLHLYLYLYIYIYKPIHMYLYVLLLLSSTGFFISINLPP